MTLIPFSVQRQPCSVIQCANDAGLTLRIAAADRFLVLNLCQTHEALFPDAPTPASSAIELLDFRKVNVVGPEAGHLGAAQGAAVEDVAA